MGSPAGGATWAAGTPRWTVFFLALVSMLAVAEAPNSKPNAELRSRKSLGSHVASYSKRCWATAPTRQPVHVPFDVYWDMHHATEIPNPTVSQQHGETSRRPLASDPPRLAALRSHRRARSRPTQGVHESRGRQARAPWIKLDSKPACVGPGKSPTLDPFPAEQDRLDFSSSVGPQWPTIVGMKPGGKLVNGGVPQNGNLSLHLATIREDFATPWPQW